MPLNSGFVVIVVWRALPPALGRVLVMRRESLALGAANLPVADASPVFPKR